MVTTRMRYQYIYRLERGSALRILDSKDATDQSIIKGAPLFNSYLSVTSNDRFQQVLNGLSKLGKFLKLFHEIS